MNKTLNKFSKNRCQTAKDLSIWCGGNKKQGVPAVFHLQALGNCLVLNPLCYLEPHQLYASPNPISLNSCCLFQEVLSAYPGSYV